MFSDINLYKNETFFNENQTGTLYLPTSTHPLQTLAIILINASDSWVFNPAPWDMIDMEDEKDRSLILEALKEAFREDRIKTVIHGYTSLGLIEMTRKRSRATWPEQQRT